MRLGDRPARAIMTPRHDLDIVDLSLEPQALLQTVQSSVHSRLLAWDPVANHAAGVVRKNDLLDAFIRDGTADPRALVRPAPIVPDTMDGFDVLDTLKNSPAHMVLVQDEYGELLGIVTTADILEAIVGAFQTDEGPAERAATERDDGSWLVAGSMPADELIELLGITAKRTADFHTVAGMVLAAMRRLPKEGDSVVVGGWRFEVLDMDGRRIDKLLATRAKTVHRAANT
jgi:putative hemolysin